MKQPYFFVKVIYFRFFLYFWVTRVHRLLTNRIEKYHNVGILWSKLAFLRRSSDFSLIGAFGFLGSIGTYLTESQNVDKTRKFGPPLIHGPLWSKLTFLCGSSDFTFIGTFGFRRIHRNITNRIRKCTNVGKTRKFGQPIIHGLVLSKLTFLRKSSDFAFIGIFGFLGSIGTYLTESENVQMLTKRENFNHPLYMGSYGANSLFC